MLNRLKRAIGLSPLEANDSVENLALAPPTQTAGYNAGADPTPLARRDVATMPTHPESTDLSQGRSRDIVTARHDEILHNQGRAAGAQRTILADAIGTGLKLSMHVDHMAVGADEEWAREFNSHIEREFRAWVGSNRKHVDRARKKTWLAIQQTAEISILKHGEILASFEPRPARGKDRIVAIRMIDPTRLSDPKDNPSAMRDKVIRGGIEYDKAGEPVAYWISSRHPRDELPAHKKFEKLTWTRFPKYGRNGRLNIFHIAAVEGVEQSRGISMIAPAIQAMKMVDELSDATLQSALLQTVFAAVIKSNANWKEVLEIVGADLDEEGDAHNALMEFQQMRGDFYRRNKPGIINDGARLVHLLPDEELSLERASNADPKVAELLSYFELEGARSFGLSAEEYSGDHSRTSFSSSRMSSQRSHRLIAQRRAATTEVFCKWVLELFIEEELIRNPGLLPNDVSFYEFRDALTACHFQGPPPIDADPVKSAKAAEQRLANGTSSHTREAALLGHDFEEIAQERARDKALLEDLGLSEPAESKAETKDETDEEQPE